MTPRTYSEEFKRQAVDRVRAGERIEDVAAALDIPRGTLWGWVKGSEVTVTAELAEPPTPIPEGFVPEATYQAALDLIDKLRQENRMLGEAARYFARRWEPR